MDLLSRVRIAKMIAKILEATANILVGVALIIAAISFISFVSSVDLAKMTPQELVQSIISEPLVDDIIIKPLVILMVSFILSVVGKLVNNMAENLEEEVKKIILGTITAMRTVDLATLAAKVGLSEKQLEQYLAQLAHDGEFKGIIKDGKVYAPTEVSQVPAPTPLPAQPPPPPTPSSPLMDMPRVNTTDEGTIVVERREGEPETMQESVQEGRLEPTEASGESKLLDLLLNGDIEGLRRLREEGRIDDSLFREAVGLIEAHRKGILSDDAFRAAAMSLARRAG